MNHNTVKIIFSIVIFLIVLGVGILGLFVLFDIDLFYFGILSILVALLLFTNLCSFVGGLYISQSLLRKGGELTTGYHEVVDKAQVGALSSLAQLGSAMVRYREQTRPSLESSNVFTLPEGGFRIED